MSEKSNAELAATIATVFGIIGAVFADNGLLAVALGDGSVQLIGPDEDIRPVQAHDGAALCLALDIDGRGLRLCVGGEHHEGGRTEKGRTVR